MLHPARLLSHRAPRLASLLAPVLLVLSASVAVAHIGGPEQLIVVGDHVDAGSTFQVLGAGIEPDVDIGVRVVSAVDSQSYDLGTIPVKADGTFDVTLTLPGAVPNGYAQFVIAQPDQGEAATVFLVGPRAEAGAPPPDGTSFLETRTGAILVLVLTLGGIAVVGFLLVRGRGTQSG